MDSMTATIPNGYLKWGDDCAEFMGSARGPAEGLEKWADHLEAVAKNLREIAEAIRVSGCHAEISGDTHMVTIAGEEGLIHALHAMELVESEECDEFDAECEEAFGDDEE